MNAQELSGWLEIDCQEADLVRGSQPVTVLGRKSDDSVIYREWGDYDGRPILRDYLWSPATAAATCSHYAPVGGGA